MGHQRLSRLLIFSVVPLSVLMFSARLAWTQEMASASQTSIQFAGSAEQFTAVPEAKTRFYPADEILSLPSAPHQGQTPSLAGFRTLEIGYHLLSTKNDAFPGLWQLAKTDDLRAKEDYFIDNTPIEWLTDPSTRHKAYSQAPDPSEDLAYYGHRIPWAGRVILNIGEKAKVHPRVFRVVELIKPGLTFGSPAPGGSVGNIHVIGRGR
jgi:hypothetical protein